MTQPADGPTQSPAAPSFRPQQRIGAYVLLEKLGAGGLGEVWKARDSRLNRVVALKFISAARRSADSTRELLREARAASALNHPNIVTIFEVGTSEDQTYLAMELVEGETLRARLGRPPVPLDDALEIAAQVASALAAAHRHGIVHRDLKPENIMLRLDGYVKLLDFGLAKVLPWAEATATNSVAALESSRTGQITGTFTYMAPEQARGLAVSPATDVFSFGIVLYEMTSGEHPFRGPTVMDTLNGILNKEPANLSSRQPSVPPALSAVVHRCLEKEPSRRFPSALELAEELKKQRTEKLAPPAVEARPRWMKAVGATLIGALLLLGGWFLRPGRGPEPTPATVQSVAVMTFRTAPNDPAAELLAQGLPENLSSELAAAGVRVAARSSVLQLEGAGDPQQLGAQLGVEAVLDGSVRSYGARFRVHVELVSTRTRFQLWSQTFTLDAGDPLVTEQKATEAIVAELRGRLAAPR